MNNNNLKGDVLVVYFSSKSNNTHRFIEKLKQPSLRIPKEETDKMLLVNKDYVLICPTYGGGHGDTKGCVPKQVIRFLNIKENREHCKGVVASGNTNFGDTFALAGNIISEKLKIPFLYKFELIGTSDDVIELNKILNKLWGK